MKKCLALALTVSAALPSIAQARPASPVPAAKTDLGRVSGKAFPGGAVFFNIPFAAPPVGDLRWTRPAPAKPWAGVRDGTKRGNACTQPDQKWNAIDAARGSEDCLYLNVWRPTGVKPHAVMVWFHGGAFIGGAGNTPLYDGEALARRGIVLVTVNYRLGLMGFLTHPGLAAQDPKGKSGNYGLMDQVEALRWVRRNVAAFGGDPRNVTIFGQSAGAASVAFLIAAPAAKGLFHRAILQSGAPFGSLLGATRRLEDVEGANAALGPIADLKRLPAAEVMDRWNKLAREAGAGLPLSPVVDGDLLPVAPGTALLAGAARHLDIIVGSNSREMPGPQSPEQLQIMARKALGDRADAVLAGYAARADKVRYGPAADQLVADLGFGCGVPRTAQSAGAAWAYTFAQPSPGEPMVRHSAEISYVFGLANHDDGVLTLRPFNAGERALAAKVATYWANFAKKGDPNGPGLPHWPKYAQPARTGVVFQNNGVAVKAFNAPACAADPRTN